jgi:hypothetical protein
VRYKLICGLNEIDLTTLGVFNSETQRGLVHAPEWVAKMKRLQEIYDQNRLTEGVGTRP